MSNHFAVTHSILSVTALLEYLHLNYEIEALIECKLINRGLNDTFLVKAENNKYILRVYRSGWRSFSDIKFELDALLHLDQAGEKISIPLKKKDGDCIGTVCAPEGQRFLVLFTYAPGKDLTYEKEEEKEAYLYGRSVAKIHLASDTFKSPHPRFVLDLNHLLDQPLESIRPILENRPEDWEYIARLAKKLRRYILGIPSDVLDTGFCHGDFHSGNAHRQSGEKITFFDFDCCGIGWRSYDIAVFFWGMRLRDKHSMWTSFFRGYTEIRDFDETNMEAIVYFVAIRQIWLIGLHVSGGKDWGFGWINDRYFDRQITFLRKWEGEYMMGMTKNLCTEQLD